MGAPGAARDEHEARRALPQPRGHHAITIDIAEEEPDVDEDSMKEAGNLGVPFMEPDHDGGEWEEWVDWSAPAVGA